MKTLLTLATLLTLSVASMAADDESSQEIRNTSVIESGTYMVTAHRVDPKEKEVYVKTADGKIVELYFKDTTKLTKGGKDVQFAELKNGQKLEVNLKKDGNHMKPVSVAILE